MRPLRPEAQRLAWAYVIDLPSTDEPVHARELALLNRPYLVGVEVTIRVGGHTSEDFDERAPELIAQAVRAGVHIRIEGHPHAVGCWWQEIKYHLEPPPHPHSLVRRERHLQVVPS